MRTSSLPIYACKALICAGLIALSAVPAAASIPGGAMPRRAGGGSAERFKVLSPAARQQMLKPAASLGRTGAPVREGVKPFSPERALEAADRVERLMSSGAQVSDWDALRKALDRAASIRGGISRCESGSLSREEVRALALQEMELENLEGLALKGSRHPASYRPPQLAPLPEGVHPAARQQPSRPEAGTPKTNTGWILDQHIFETASSDIYPSLNSDYRHYDEGQNDITMGHSDHPGQGSMFGWVWQVQSFYWTDTTLVSDHANPSYCLFVMVSFDGGFTWLLYEVLYDPTGEGHTTSLDMINPKLAMDITGTTGGGPSAYDRFYIAYEYANSDTDHDVHVYSETSVLDQPGPSYVTDAQDAAIGTTIL